MLEIFEALVAIPAAKEAEVETKDPEISVAICAEEERIPCPDEAIKPKSLFSCDIADPETTTFFQLAIII